MEGQDEACKRWADKAVALAEVLAVSEDGGASGGDSLLRELRGKYEALDLGLGLGLGSGSGMGSGRGEDEGLE